MLPSYIIQFPESLRDLLAELLENRGDMQGFVTKRSLDIVVRAGSRFSSSFGGFTSLQRLPCAPALATTRMIRRGMLVTNG